MTTDEVIRRLDAFALSGDESTDIAQLYALLDDEWEQATDRERAMPSLFALLERFPDAELGTPGPIAHALEAMGGCASALRKSLLRQPTHLTVWMVNRILNTTHDAAERRVWLSVLAEAAHHPHASTSTKEHVRHFLSFQSERDG